MKDVSKLLAKVKRILLRHEKEIEEKRKAGTCIEPKCKKPALKDTSKYAYGEDFCEEHAKAAELEELIEEQEDDLKNG